MRRVYIVEDHPVVRDMVEAYIERIAEIHVCGRAESGEIALTEIGAARPTIVIADLSLPEMSGLELIATIRRRWPHVRTLVLSAHVERHYLARALSAGADAYVCKGIPHELRDALDAMERGDRYVSPTLQLH